MRPRPAVARLCAYLGVALLAVAAWLSGRPILTTDRNALEEWLLVDVSDSMRLARRDFAAQLDQLLEDAARRQAGAGSAQEAREFRWIAFGNGVREQRGPSASGALSSIDGSASDLAQALELVEARMAEQGRVRLRIWSDGGFTGADPGAVLERLAREGVGIEWLEVPPRDAPELYLADVRAPFEAAPGERVVLRVSLSAFGEGSARVRYGFRGGAALQRELAINAGGPLEFELVAGAMGARADELFVELEGRARERWRAPIRLRAERSALHIGGAALSQSLHWIDAAPAEVLATLDLLVTSRSGPAHSELEAIEPFVARGGTWLQFATPERGLEAGPLAALEPRMPGNPGQDWVVLLDGSGSMRGERWARLLGAWARLERLLPAGTRIEKRIFAAEIGPALAELPPDAPGGPTALVESLERWSQAGAAQSPLAGGGALLVISDGEDRLGAAALARAKALRQNWQGELHAIAVSPGGVARPAVLAALAGSADRVLDAGNLLEEGAEQRLFETLRGVLERRLWQVEPRKLREGALWVTQHISARVVAGAQLLVELEDGSPLVAERAHGLGRVISIACPPGAVQGADRERWLASWCQVRSAPAPRLVLNSGALVLEDAGSLEANGGLELAGTLLSWVERDGSRMRVPISRLPGGRVGWSFEAQWPARSAEQGPELLRPGAPALALAWPQSWSPESRPDRRELAPQALRPVPAREREGRDPRGPLVVTFLLLGLVALGLAAWGGFFHTSGAGVQARGGLFRSKTP